MAAPGTTYATGADQKADDLRRRNVPQKQSSNGQVKVLPEQEKVKIQQQVHLSSTLGFWGLLTSHAQTNGLVAFLDEYEFILAPILFTFLAFFTRMWKIGLSDIVTWDEAQ